MRIALLVLALFGLAVATAEEDSFAEFRQQVATDFADLPPDDPSRVAVLALVERLAASPEAERNRWHLHLLRTSLEVAQVLQRLASVEPDPAGQALIQVIQTAGSAADLANRRMVEAVLAGENQQMAAAVEAYTAVNNRWHRLSELVELVLDRAERREHIEALLVELPEADRAVMLVRRQAGEDRLRDAALALRTAQLGGKMVDELTAIGAVRAAGVNLELFTLGLEMEIEIRTRPADAEPSPELLARIRTSYAALSDNRLALVDLETQQALLEYRQEGLWDRDSRCESLLDTLRSAWSAGETSVDDEGMMPTTAERDLTP